MNSYVTQNNTQTSWGWRVCCLLKVNNYFFTRHGGELLFQLWSESFAVFLLLRKDSFPVTDELVYSC